jgi:hypothetical protein
MPDKPLKRNNRLEPHFAAFYLAIIFTLIFGANLELRMHPRPEIKAENAPLLKRAIMP